MFTGIIEITGSIRSVKKSGGNINIEVNSAFTSKLKLNQSIAHNGVCLSVTDIKKNYYTVTAIKETLQKTNLGNLKKGDFVNIERSLKVSDRLDGHIVQGHVDTVAVCRKIKAKRGSWLFTFVHKKSKGFITVEKGSVCINGVSLTVINSKKYEFSVAIIPSTYLCTNFHKLKTGDAVNIEFDIVGKYLSKIFMLK